MTARHSAAVARYARAIAEELGCNERASRSSSTPPACCTTSASSPSRTASCSPTASSRTTTGRSSSTHPAQGARLVRRIDGYGPVADIILAHHERIDGTRLPARPAGEKIPLISRMISVADTYDVMTARDSYREPVSAGRGDRRAATRLRHPARRRRRRGVRPHPRAQADSRSSTRRTPISRQNWASRPALHALQAGVQPSHLRATE